MSRTLRTVTLALLTCFSHAILAKTTVYGLTHIHHISAKAKAPFYLQVGAFSTAQAADQVKNQYTHYGFPVHIEPRGSMHAVVMGPIPTRVALQAIVPEPKPQMRNSQPPQAQINEYRLNKHSVHRFYHQSHQEENPNWLAPETHEYNTKRTPYSRDPSYVVPPDQTKTSWLLDEDHWYIEFEGGLAFPNYNNIMTVDNGSSYPPPYNIDIYTTHKNNQGLIAISAGKRWKLPLTYINRATLGLRYQYLIKRNVGGTITQYNLPQFLNYNYTWDIASNALTADTKLNFTEWRNLSLYLNAGIGGSLNQTSGYGETAIAPVTPRISAGYQNSSKSQFTYHAGVGLDYRLKEEWLASLGYEYEQLGYFNSGNGSGSWSSESLSLGKYSANTIRFGITYLTDRLA